MFTWNAEQYLQFAEERTRPNWELAGRIRTETVRKIIDLGCGPGNSTAVLAERWPAAAIAGLDGSAEMLDHARRTYPQHRWIHGDIAQWAATTEETYDIVFSCAALQWVGDHATLYPNLLRRVAPGGTLAVHMPYSWEEPFHAILCDLQSSEAWHRRLPPAGVRPRHGHDYGFYYDLLATGTTGASIWETKYFAVLPGVEGIVDWLAGTALRPFADALPDESDYQSFVEDFARALRSEYKPRADGNVLFPYRRLFLVATRCL
jgi:trans-aconitate 2-methyltransferase